MCQIKVCECDKKPPANNDDKDKICGAKEKEKENHKASKDKENDKPKDTKCDKDDDCQGCELTKCKSVELRSGNYLICQCVKRNGLQDHCPRTCCQGSKLCMTQPEPKCCPSQFLFRYININHGTRKIVDLNNKMSDRFYKF